MTKLRQIRTIRIASKVVGVTQIESPQEDGVFGCYDSGTNTIFIYKGLSEQEYARILLHEIFHVCLEFMGLAYQHDSFMTNEEYLANLFEANTILMAIENRENLIEIIRNL